MLALHDPNEWLRRHGRLWMPQPYPYKGFDNCRNQALTFRPTLTVCHVYQNSYLMALGYSWPSKGGMLFQKHHIIMSTFILELSVLRLLIWVSPSSIAVFFFGKF
jgi:hypothetical protein